MDWLRILKLNAAKTTNEDGSLKGDQIKDKEIATPALEEMAISGPYTSGNLAVFMIHGSDAAALHDMLTLEEALELKQVVLKETSNVSELQINNLGDKAVFIQSGDIVMGGKQDRTLQFDMILTPKSGFVPIKSFCVERERWTRRQGESASEFHSSPHYLSSHKLRMANKYSHDQGTVWDEVSNMQERTSMHLEHDTHSSVSPSSLPLSMEDEKVKEATDRYLHDLTAVADQATNIVGYALAINGQVNNIDVYSCGTLFRKLWPKLLKASAVEAFSELDEKVSYMPPTVDKVLDCMTDAERGKASDKGLSHKTRTIQKESPNNVLFETRDTANGDTWVHRNYAAK